MLWELITSWYSEEGGGYSTGVELNDTVSQDHVRVADK